tara:strand:+ start:37 stop:1050 length:1014 start_codon:yes stop_codon:yes gene_type:complete
MVNDLNLSDRPFDREAIKNSSRYRALTVFLKVIGDSSNVNESYVINRDLPENIDNQLYFLSHYIGGFTTMDVGRFVKNSTPKQIRLLGQLLNRVPSDQYELIPLAGMYKSIYDSPDYQKLISLILGTLTEDVDVGADGYYTTDTNPYFTRYVTPEVKKQIFGYWDKHGICYDCLKYFGVDVEEEDMEGYTDFRNIGDIVYPLLVMEYGGGLENTEFAKAPWRHTSEMGFENLKFKVEPIAFDYMFDEAEHFGEHGYACWDIRVLIDKDSDLVTSEPPSDWDKPFVQQLFPESARNKVSSYRNYNEDQYELIELLWEYYHEEASELSSQFCRVEVVLV